MTKENFLDAVRRRFLEDIREAYVECAHGPGKPVDFARLGKILSQLQGFAKKAGVTPSEFEELTMICLPGMLPTTNVVDLQNYRQKSHPHIRTRRAA